MNVPHDDTFIYNSTHLPNMRGTLSTFVNGGMTGVTTQTPVSNTIVNCTQEITVTNSRLDVKVCSNVIIDTRTTPDNFDHLYLNVWIHHHRLLQVKPKEILMIHQAWVLIMMMINVLLFQVMSWNVDRFQHRLTSCLTKQMTIHQLR